MSEDLKNLKLYPYVFNFVTYFAMKLFNEGHTTVKIWFKKTDIFEYDLVFVPIPIDFKTHIVSSSIEETSHWILAVIDIPKKEIAPMIQKALRDLANSLILSLKSLHLGIF